MTTKFTLLLCLFWLFKKLPGKPVWPNSLHWKLFFASDFPKDCRETTVTREVTLHTVQWCTANSDCDFPKDCWSNHCDHTGHTSAQREATFSTWRLTEKPLQDYNQCSEALFKTVWRKFWDCGGLGLTAKLPNICWCFESWVLQVNWLQWYVQILIFHTLFTH